jgi:hypothetical protein
VTLTYGGPIQKNKTFFFVSWEQQSSLTRSLQTASVFTDAAREGVFRYWERWNPDDAASPVPTFPASLTQGVHPSVDYSGESVETGPQSGQHTVQRQPAMLQCVRQREGQW